MPESGGTTTQSGVNYQNSVEALFLGDMLDSQGKPPCETVVWVRGEAPTPVDDICIGFADEHRAFVHCKESIVVNSPEWHELWGDFCQQFNGDFVKGRDEIFLYVGALTRPLGQLREMCKRSRGSTTSEEWTNSLTDEHLKMRDGEEHTSTLAIRDHLLAPLREPQTLLEFFQHVHVFICPAEDVRQYEARRRMPGCSVSPSTLFDLLLPQVARNARYRVPLQAESLRRTLEEEHDIQFVALPSESELRRLFKSCSSVLRGQRDTIGRKGPHRREIARRSTGFARIVGQISGGHRRKFLRGAKAKPPCRSRTARDRNS